VLLLDSCRNAAYASKGEGDGEPMSENFVRSFNFERRNRGIKAFATFMATNVGQQAYESSRKKQGFFTWAFVEGLKGAAANQRGEVTLAGMKSYVQATVTDLVKTELRADAQQPDAFFQGYKSEELVISVAPRGAGAAAAAPAAAGEMTARNPQGITDEGFWFAIKDSDSVREYKLYLNFFPRGQFADVARNKVAALESPGPTPTPVAASMPLPTPTPARPAATPAPAGVLKDLYGESHALVIGVSEYLKGFPSLKGVREDVPAVSHALRAHGFEVETLMNPTRSQFDAAVRQFIAKHGYERDNRLVIYYSGNGHTLRTADGVTEGYLVPADAPTPTDNLAAFKETAVSMSEIEMYARRIESKHALFVLDACFAGSVFYSSRGVTRPAPSLPAQFVTGAGLRRPPTLSELTISGLPPNILSKVSQPVRQFIASGTADQSVPEDSIFRRLFVQGLQGAADINSDGYITGSELGIYLQDTVSRQSDGNQTPQWGSIRDARLDKGDIVFTVPLTR
jgi:hypothetical protein